MRSTTLLVLVTGALLAPACATTPGPADLPARELSGHLATDERGSWFTPCPEPEATRWWVTFTDDSVEQIREARAEGLARPGSRAFVRWRAAVTDERLVGPGGPVLLLREIQEIRPPADGDCQGAG